MAEPEEREYRVFWEIDLTGTSPRAVAEQAHDMMQDPASYAVIFEVKPAALADDNPLSADDVVTVDLEAPACPACKGVGWTDGARCQQCEGTGDSSYNQT
jgi:hypothetical protein